MKRFSLSYLPGFLAERYDVSEDECRKRAHRRVEDSVKKLINNSIKRDVIQERNEKFDYEGERTWYALFLLYLIAVESIYLTCCWVRGFNYMYATIIVAAWPLLNLLTFEGKEE